jgi:regulator of replication initiation timing
MHFRHSQDENRRLKSENDSLKEKLNEMEKSMRQMEKKIAILEGNSKRKFSDLPFNNNKKIVLGKGFFLFTGNTFLI